MGNRPFTMFDNPFEKKFLKALNAAYKPASRKLLSGQLLDSVYSVIKKHTDEVIAAMPNINVSTNESAKVPLLGDMKFSSSIAKSVFFLVSKCSIINVTIRAPSAISHSHTSSAVHPKAALALESIPAALKTPSIELRLLETA